MKRRKLLTIASLATTGMLLPIGFNSWVARGIDSANNRRRLVVVFLRGGMDGLNVLVPHQEADYYKVRPTIAVPYPDRENGAIDLDGFFGLHPKLKALLPLWKEKKLAFIHASGLPMVERSHFEAQDYIESGTPGIKSTSDGWMNRLLAEFSQNRSTQALNVGVTTPYILRGKMEVANLKPGKNSTAPIPTDRPQVDRAFGNLYSGEDLLSKAYQDGRKAREIILKDLTQEMMSANRTAKDANAFVDDAAEVARLMVGDAQTQLAFMEIGGWDTHINQNNTFNRLLPPLAEGLVTLTKGLEPIFSDTAIVVISEFGRTVKENGNQGTDHGYGNVMFLLGGAIKGKKIYTEWSGLDSSALYENRDLPVTTDFREPLSIILKQRLDISDSSLNRVFPNFKTHQKLDFLS